MVELTSRNDHINQIWTRMYLTLHQTFITVLLFFSSKQTWLRIQIMPLSFLSQHLLFYFIAPQCTIKAGHSAVWVDNNRLINFQKPTDSETENVFSRLSKRMKNKTSIYKSGPQTSAFDSYYLQYPVPSSEDVKTYSTHPLLFTFVCIYIYMPEETGRIASKSAEISGRKLEDQASNLLPRTFANREGPAKGFVSGPMHWGGNFLHWFLVWQLTSNPCI